MIVDRLTKAALGQTDISPTELKAAEILLRKTLPDLTAQTLSIETAPQTRQDIVAAAIAKGIDPEMLFADDPSEAATIEALPAPAQNVDTDHNDDPPTPGLRDQD